MLHGQVSQGEIQGRGGRGVRQEGKGRVCSILTGWKGSFPEAVNVCCLWEQWEGWASHLKTFVFSEGGGPGGE